MSPQTKISIEVVSISRLSANMIFWNKKRIEAVYRSHCRVEIVKQLKLFSWHSNIRKLMSTISIEKGMSFCDKCSQRMLWLFVKLSLSQIKYSLRNIGEVICC